MGKDWGAYQDPVLSTTKVEKPEEKKKRETKIKSGLSKTFKSYIVLGINWI